MNSHTMPTQAEQILDALKQGRKITALDALNEFGCMRLGARVLELKREGYVIESERFKTPSGKNVVRYHLAAIPEPDTTTQAHHQPTRA